MASGIYGSCLSCLNEFSLSRYPVILVGCACADRMCQICSSKWFKHDQQPQEDSLAEKNIKMCQACQYPVLGVQPDRFFIAHMQKLNHERLSHQNVCSSSTDIATIDISKALHRESYQQVISDERYHQLLNNYKSSELKTFMCAVSELETAAVTEDIRVLFLLYKIYMSGEKIPRHSEKAANYLLRAASNGCLKSKTILGMYYVLGIHFKKNISLGLKCLKDAAEVGHLKAIHLLVFLYDPSNRPICHLNIEKEQHQLDPSDHQLIQNQELHLYYLKKSAEQGVVNSYLKLALNAYNDRRIPTADERCYLALEYLEEAKKLGIKLKVDIELCRKIEINLATTLNGSEKPSTSQFALQGTSQAAEGKGDSINFCLYQ